ncbi:protein of unknown function [Paraburkholderia kururiensis]
MRRCGRFTWAAEQTVRTLSAQSLPSPIVPTPSAISAGRSSVSPAGDAPELAAVAQAFPPPWSAYARLLSVKTAAAMLFTKLRRCAKDVSAPTRPSN